jgi:HTH-type transcriptional regulator, glycine betaine synthesis regulator
MAPDVRGSLRATTYRKRPFMRSSLASANASAYNFHIFLKGIKRMKIAKTGLRERLDAVEDEFVDLWNNMANLWGISPTMARIHGLLFICGAALSMDDIMARLAISRGNVSMNLSKLMEWGLVRRIHKKGKRKEYYQSLGDVWEMFTLVATQRKRREIDPILSTLRRCRDELSPTNQFGGIAEEAAQMRLQRVNELLKFLTLLDSLALRFFESHKGLREAVELLAQED